MSTKTLRKRIALVAVTALGAGLLSVAPANATAVSAATTMFVGITPSITGSAAGNLAVESTTSIGWIAKTATGTTIISGGLAVSTLGYELNTGGTSTGVVAAGAQIPVTVSGSATGSTRTSIVVTGGTLSGVTSTTALSTGSGVASDRSYVVNATASATEYTAAVATASSGATTMTIASYSGTGVSMTTPTNGTLNGIWTLTVASAAASGVYDPKYSYVTQQPAVAVSAAINLASNTYDTTSAAKNGYYNVIWVRLSDVFGAGIGTGTLAASATNGSLVKFGSTAGVNYTGTASFDTTSPATPAGVWLSVKQPVANTAGSTTVTLTHNGQTVGTKTVSWTGDLAKITVGGLGIGTAGTTGSFSYKFFDAAGNRIADANTSGGIGTLALVSTGDGNTNNITVKSSTLEDGSTGNRYTTATWTGRYTFNCTSTTKSTSLAIKVKATNTALATITSDAFNAECSGDAIDTYTVALNKAQYQTGDVATLTITAKDARGKGVAAATTLGDGAAIALGGMTAVTAPTTADYSYNGDGVWTYTYTVGTTAGSYVASIALPSSLTDDAAKTIQYKIVASDGGVSNADVLKAIVSLIASINKQIAALQKALLKK